MHYPIRAKPVVDTSIDGHVIEYDQLLSHEMTKDIIQFALTDDSFHRRGSKSSSVKASFTTCLLHDINHPVYKILDNVWKTHAENHQYDLSFIEYYEIKSYYVGDKFGEHVDTHGAPKMLQERKLNLTIQLSDPDSYEGGDLYIKEHHATRQLGSGIFFPPYVLHKITEITSGTRYCLIGHGWGNFNRK
jgi:hypothetical protein